MKTAEPSQSWLVRPRVRPPLLFGLCLSGAVVVLALGQVFEPAHLFVWFNLSRCASWAADVPAGLSYIASNNATP